MPDHSSPRIGRLLRSCLALAVSSLAMAVPLHAQAPAPVMPAASTDDTLAAQFRDPPDSARPRVWWHWLSGNIAKAGIHADLEWMKSVGLAGVQMFDGDMGAPQIVPHRVKALSPEWLDDLHYAASEADRLGLEFAMAAAPGWSETGGPWVSPESGMKKLVWSETRVRGGQGRIALPALPSTPGPFLDLPKRSQSGELEMLVKPYARDVAVVAYRAPVGEVALKPAIASNQSGLALDTLVDGHLDGGVTLRDPTPDAPVWVRYDFAQPVTLRAFTYAGPLGGRFADGPVGRIEASQDGQQWRAVRNLVGPAHNPAPERTLAFPATTARYFRVVFEQSAQSREPYPHGPGIALHELAPVAGGRVDLFEDKAGFGVLPDLDIPAAPPSDTAGAIAKGGVLDLTSHLRGDGTLDWTPPPGDWIILRMGYSPTGEVNHPATPEATGPEADKLNAAHVQAHLDAYMTPVIKKLGDLVGPRGLRYMVTDSWEAGTENWTEAMLAQFRKRRGYDLAPWLPVLAGRIVGDAAQSDAVLWDLRRTLADLLAENHYGTITRFAKAHGLGYYGEAVGAAMPTVADGMLSKSYTDIPMGEFWAMPFGGQPAAYQGVAANEFPGDIIETASTAHVYGKPLVAAESLTSSQPQWTSTPWTLKWVADKYMAMGVNRLVIHTSPHQPDDTHKPGLTLGPFGQAFTRNEIWAPMARPWLDYLARGSYLLQQGTPVADLLYFTGEGATTGVPYRDAGTPADPRGHGFDYVNADALLRLAQVRDGQITFPGGASYRLLVLPDQARPMSLPLLRHLADLVDQGANVLGPRPVASPSLADDKAQFEDLTARLWGDLDGKILTRHAVGKGQVFAGLTAPQALEALGVDKDMDFASATPGMDIRFAHRRLPDGDLYFLTNQSPASGPVTASLRSTGRVPELWHADTGQSEPVSYAIHDGVTDVALTLAPYEAVFVVLRAEATHQALTVPAVSERELASYDAGWQVSFPAAAGAPEKHLTLPSLASWTTQPDPALRYFSGIATYTRQIDLPRGAARQRLALDLGDIVDVAEVRVNGVVVGTLWKKPYRIEMTGALRAGANAVEIRVANVWRNRLVGDLQPGAKPTTFTSQPAGGGFAALGGVLSKDTPLLPAGLLRPVRLLALDTAHSDTQP